MSSSGIDDLHSGWDRRVSGIQVIGDISGWDRRILLIKGIGDLHDHYFGNRLISRDLIF